MVYICFYTFFYSSKEVEVKKTTKSGPIAELWTNTRLSEYFESIDTIIILVSHNKAWLYFPLLSISELSRF